VALELDGIEDRTVRLSHHSAACPTPISRPTARRSSTSRSFEKGFDLWKYVPRKKEVKLVAKLDAERTARLRLDAEGKKAIVLADEKLSSVDLESGKATPVKVRPGWS
jgi:hypothetical protein